MDVAGNATVLGRAVPGQIPTTPIDVQVVNGQGPSLDGHALIPIEVGHSDDTTVLWVPSLKLAVAGDVVYNGVHLALTEPGSRGRPKYVITPLGMDLVPAVMGLMQWGDRYRADPEGPPVHARHRGCGAHVDAQIHCERGHHVQAPDIESVPGPSFRLRRAE